MIFRAFNKNFNRFLFCIISIDTYEKNINLHHGHYRNNYNFSSMPNTRAINSRSSSLSRRPNKSIQHQVDYDGIRNFKTKKIVRGA